MAWLSFATSLLALASTTTAAVQPIEVKGSKFFYQNGTQFFIKGIAYQQNSAAAGGASRATKYIDPLADEASCRRDIPLLQELGTNTIRTYAIDPTANHDVCMGLLQDAGIYVISDLGEPDASINREDPQWTVRLFRRYRRVVDALAPYPNVIGFLAGNEVTDRADNSNASAFVKAAVRDTKRYIRENTRITRWLGVGYAANDAGDIRDHITDYFNCHSVDDSVDFWGYNVYSWCGDSTIEKSKYDQRAAFFANYSVPTFFAEYGCREVPGGGAARKFTETAALYSDALTPSISGGIVYMYFQEQNDYGLVSVSNGQLTKLQAFEALKAQIAKARPKAIHRDAYHPSTPLRPCPPISSTWASHPNLPPTPNQPLCDCMLKSRSCVPSSDASPKSYPDIFNYICGRSADYCAGIHIDPQTGSYGNYSMCDDAEKLAHILDAYYKDQNSALACKFDGAAMLRKPSEQEAACAAIAANAGVVDDANAKDDADSSAVRGLVFARGLVVGGFVVEFYMLAAFAVGMAVVLL